MSQEPRQVNENSLVLFLKENEYLFTILGVFLVLAFIFNSPQFISFVDPKSQSTDVELQIYCTNNATEQPFKATSTIPATQLNCTGLSTTRSDISSNQNFYSNTSRTFSFLCLLLAFIIYFIICYNLYLALRQCVNKTAEIFKEPVSMKKITNDCMILFIVPFFYQGALWYFALLMNIFPDMMANAVFSIVCTMLLIEFFAIMSIASELDRMVQGSKKKTLILSGIFLIVSIFAFISAYLQENLTIILVFALFGIIILSYSIKGIRRYLEKRHNLDVYEVN
jgi:hypothetical protein